MPLRFPRYEKSSRPLGVNDKVLRSVVARVNKTFQKKKDKDALTITTLGDSVFSKPRSYVSSGVLPIDCIVCYGLGFPSGIVELFGNEASGKTAVLENTLAEAQRRGFYTIIFPTEYSLDYRRVKTLHLDQDRLLIADAETIEDVYAQIKSITTEIRKRDATTPIVIGWDSIAATPTRSELEHKAGLEASDMGKAAQQMSKLFRRLVRFLFINKVCLICVNQVRANLAVMYGNKESTFGGKALKFYAWVRARMKQLKLIEGETGESIGCMYELRVVKNKVAPPFMSCRFPIYWKTGINKSLAVWEFAIDRKIFVRKGTTYRYKKQVMTRKSFPRFYKEHREEINAALRQSMKDIV